jgi:hypothetical protein
VSLVGGDVRQVPRKRAFGKLTLPRRNFDIEQIGQARPAFFSGRLFGRHVPGACDWSRAHTLTDMPGADRMKFGIEGHPIEQEGRKRKMEPTPEYRARQVKAERELLRRAVGDERGLFNEVLNKMEAKELIDKVGDKVDQDYIHDFRNWIVGIGKRSDYIKAGVPLTSVGQAKPLSHHKSVIDFVDRITGRVVDYYAEIVNMKMRGPGVGRKGGPATLEDLWLYFKYVVRNDPIDPKDFAPAPEPVDDDVRGNGMEGLPPAHGKPHPGGMVDKKAAAPSTDDRDFGPEDKALRRMQPQGDTQMREKEAPKAKLDVIADAAADGDGGDKDLDGGAPDDEPPETESFADSQRKETAALLAKMSDAQKAELLKALQEKFGKFADGKSLEELMHVTPYTSRDMAGDILGRGS